MSYSVIEEAIRQALVAHYPDDLNDNRCRRGDVDGVYEAMMSEGANVGCLIEYAGGERLIDPPFQGRVWNWLTTCFLFVRYQGDNALIESEARRLIDILWSLFADDHTLGGVTPAVKLSAILQPEPGKINDTPLYWITFHIEALDKA